MSSPHKKVPLDELATAVLAAIAPLGSPVAERYVRSLRFIGTAGLRAEGNTANGQDAASVYEALSMMTARERDIACLRDATSTTPRLSVDWLAADLQSAGPLRCWAALIAAARGCELTRFLRQLEPYRSTATPAATLFEVAEKLATWEQGAEATVEAIPAMRRDVPDRPPSGSERAASSNRSEAVQSSPATSAVQEPPLAVQVAGLEAAARKTGDPAARAALYHRVGRLHEEELGAPQSALESFLLAFMLDPLPFDHFVSVERACLQAARYRDLAQVYQSGVEAIDAGACYRLTSAELLWRCLQTQEGRLLRVADAENTAARLAMEPSASPELLAQLLNWLQGRVPRNEALVALVASRLPAP